VSAKERFTGFLLIDKESGWTSHDVVAKVRGLTGKRKIGHAGTLDPMATGLVVLGLGKATRLLRFVQEAPKEYVARARFGVATDSLDADGAVLSREPMPVSEAEVVTAMSRFVGRVAQIPPMVSARKVEGRRLYELAREGIEVEREARTVEISSLELLDFAPSDYPEVAFRVVCSKGTYVRTLADDVARALGGRAHLTSLRRLRNGSLRVDDAHSVDEVAAAGPDWRDLALPAAAGLPDLPQVTVGDDAKVAVRNGVVFQAAALVDGVDDGPVRLVDNAGALLAVYRVGAGRAKAEVVLS
jgi:tRNA pseudouridine55 synthase